MALNKDDIIIPQATLKQIARCLNANPKFKEVAFWTHYLDEFCAAQFGISCSISLDLGAAILELGHVPKSLHKDVIRYVSQPPQTLDSKKAGPILLEARRLLAQYEPAYIPATFKYLRDFFFVFRNAPYRSIRAAELDQFWEHLELSTLSQEGGIQLLIDTFFKCEVNDVVPDLIGIPMSSSANDIGRWGPFAGLMLWESSSSFPNLYAEYLDHYITVHSELHEREKCRRAIEVAFRVSLAHEHGINNAIRTDYIRRANNFDEEVAFIKSMQVKYDSKSTQHGCKKIMAHIKHMRKFKPYKPRQMKPKQIHVTPARFGDPFTIDASKGLSLGILALLKLVFSSARK